MDRESPARRVLERTADVAIVGCLTTAAGVTVITAPAALAAAVHILIRQERGTSLVADYLHTLRGALKTGSQLGAACAVALLIGTVDLVWATGAPLTLLSSAVLAAGLLLVLAACAVTATAVVRIGQSQNASPQPVRLSVVLRRASLEAAAAPHRSLALALFAGMSVLLALCALPLIPLIVGVVALVLPRAAPPAVARRAPSPPPEAALS